MLPGSSESKTYKPILYETPTKAFNFQKAFKKEEKFCWWGRSKENLCDLQFQAVVRWDKLSARVLSLSRQGICFFVKSSFTNC